VVACTHQEECSLPLRFDGETSGVGLEETACQCGRGSSRIHPHKAGGTRTNFGASAVSSSDSTVCSVARFTAQSGGMQTGAASLNLACLARIPWQTFEPRTKRKQASCVSVEKGMASASSDTAHFICFRSCVNRCKKRRLGNAWTGMPQRSCSKQKACCQMSLPARLVAPLFD
jgi:hypothetical protein